VGEAHRNELGKWRESRVTYEDEQDKLIAESRRMYSWGEPWARARIDEFFYRFTGFLRSVVEGEWNMALSYHNIMFPVDMPP
jgi:hypothetical protein